MKNRFICSPTAETARKASSEFGFAVSDPISLDLNDFLNVTRDADNVVIAEGCGCGSTRMADAVGQLLANAEQAAAGLNVYTASKVLLQIQFTGDAPLRMDEVGPMQSLVGRFGKGHNCVWGLSKKRPVSGRGSTVILRMMAANLQPRTLFA